MSDPETPRPIAAIAAGVVEADRPEAIPARPWVIDDDGNYEMPGTGGVWTDGSCHRCGWPEPEPVAAITDACTHGNAKQTATLIAVSVNAAPALAEFVINAVELLRSLAESNPIAMVEYESDWSDVTPGAGPIEGCIHCKSTYATTDRGHDDGCRWVAARALLAEYGETP